MTPMEVLRAEHRLIERGLDVLEALAGRVARNMSLAPEPPRQIHAFLRDFADGIHHAKEEQELFPSLLDHGAERQGGLVQMMLAEHADGRAYVREIGETVTLGLTSDESRERFVVAARAYADMLRHHIVKEDQALWPLAERLLPAEAMAELDRRFTAHAESNAAARAQWERVIDRLIAELFRTPRTAAAG